MRARMQTLILVLVLLGAAAAGALVGLLPMAAGLRALARLEF